MRATRSTRSISAHTIGALRLAESFAGQHYRGGAGSVDLVGFAVTCAALPFRAAYLDDRDTVGTQVARQARSVMAGTLDTYRGLPPQRVRPGHKAAVASGRGVRPPGAQRSTELIDRIGDVDLLVCVDTDGDL